MSLIPKKGTVYVVDDDEAVRDSLQWLLEGKDYRVKCFDSSESFLARFDPARDGLWLLVDGGRILGSLVLDGVDIVEDAKSVTYFHMLFDQHQIVYADGAMAESLYIGPEALLTVGKEAILEILRILPGLRVLDTDNLPQPARPLVRGRFARRFAYRHLQNNLPVCSPITAMEASKQRTSA